MRLKMNIKEIVCAKCGMELSIEYFPSVDGTSIHAMPCSCAVYSPEMKLIVQADNEIFSAAGKWYKLKELLRGKK